MVMKSNCVYDSTPLFSEQLHHLTGGMASFNLKAPGSRTAVSARVDL
jgi:hypothetical protein